MLSHIFPTVVINFQLKCFLCKLALASFYTYIPIDFDNCTNCIHSTISPRTPSGSLLDLPGTLPERPCTLQDPLGSAWDKKVAPGIVKKTIIFDKNCAKSKPETPQIRTDEVSEPALYMTYTSTQKQKTTLHTTSRAARRNAQSD